MVKTVVLPQLHLSWNSLPGALHRGEELMGGLFRALHKGAGQESHVHRDMATQN